MCVSYSVELIECKDRQIKEENMSFKEKFNIEDEVEFMDIELGTDSKLFVDPYLIYISTDDFSNNCSNKIVKYFEQLLNSAVLKDKGNGYKIVRYLQENNEVRFGYSLGRPLGKGFGKNKGKELFDILCKSKAVKTGLISDIFDASIMLDKIGYDKISDLTINIILEDLILFTQEQCKMYNVPMVSVKLRRPIWNSERNNWINSGQINLPVYEDEPIILVPKNFVRPYMIYTYNRFYNNQMMPYYEKEVMKDPSCGLVKILKRGVVPAKTKIRKKYPCLKDNVVEFINEHPEEYSNYKYKQLNYMREENV